MREVRLVVVCADGTHAPAPVRRRGALAREHRENSPTGLAAAANKTDDSLSRTALSVLVP